jgi:thin aggregative fimbriae synthesis protein
MRSLFLAALLVSYSALAADYRLDPGATVRDGTLQVSPTVQGPAGAALRYEVKTVREGAAGRSNSSQSGNVRLGQDGSAKLATTSVSVTPQDRYRISVRVLERDKVVAEEEVLYPN